MESTYVRRRPRSGSRTAAGKKNELAPRERRRLIQLAASIGLFLLVFLGRGVFPVQTSQWKQLLASSTDFSAAFSRLGEAVSQGELLDTLGELCTEVFAGSLVTDSAPDPRWDWAPTFSQRMRTQLEHPQDALGLWGQSRRRASTGAESGPEGEEESAALQTAPAAGEGAAMTAQRTLAADVQVVTAVPQAYTQDGLALPDSVSMAFYYLGLEKTVTPVTAVLTSDYGYRDHPVSGEYLFHRGVDLGAALGTEITAFADGTVAYTGCDDTCGLYLQIQHANGVTTFYAHCSQIDVLDGQQVTAGQVIARVGATGNATGPHLHFALRKDGVYLDPLYYIEVG